jgi:hypothetical protein
MDKDRILRLEISRVLLYLVDHSDQKIFSQVVQVCKMFKSQLFVLFVLEDSRISKLATLTHEKVETIRQRIEEEGWEMLYLVEDEAVDHGVRTSLHLEEGQILKAIKKFVEAYDIQMLLMRRREETKKVFISANVPVIGL